MTKFTGMIGIEFLKLKRRGIPYLLTGTALFSIVTAYLPSITTGYFDWQELFSSSQFIFNQILFLLTGYLTGVLFAGEYETNTMEPVFTTPVSMKSLVGAKACTVIILLILTMLCAVCLTLPAGVVLGCGSLSLHLFGIYLKTGASVVLIHIGYIPFYMLAGILSRKTIVPSVFGIFMTLIIMVFVTADYACYVPPCIPTLVQAVMLGGNAYFTEFLHGAPLAHPDYLFLAISTILAVTLPLPVIPRCYRRY